MPDRSGWERRRPFELHGRTALVYGVEHPAGAAAASALAEAGARVALVASSPDGHAAQVRLRDALVGTVDIATDTWDAAAHGAVAAGMEDLVVAFGAPEILVTATDAWLARPIEATSDLDLQHVLAVNLSSVYAACREFLRHLPAGTPDARIICITGIFGQRGVDALSAYGAAQGGVHNLVRVLAQETGARDGLTVNAIATGWMTDTPGRGPDELGANRLMRFVPQRRFGEPSDVGPLVLLLAGGGSGYISGQILHVDGGVTTHL